MFSENDFLQDVILGKMPGFKIMRGLGERESIGTTATGEDLWRGNELAGTVTSHTRVPTPAAAGELMSFVCENTNDKAGGTGAQELTFEYLDSKGLENTVVIPTDGTTVTSLGANIKPMFINDMYASAVGSSNVAVGHISVFKTGTIGLRYNMISAGTNKSLVPHRMVPAGKNLSLWNWICSEGNNKRLIMRLRADCNNDYPPLKQIGVFLFKSVAYLNQGTSGPMPLAYWIPSLCIVKVSVWAVAINGEGSVHWWGLLKDD